MPQMMPLNWLILFIYILLIMYMFMVILNFTVLYKNIVVDSHLNLKLNSYNWLW